MKLNEPQVSVVIVLILILLGGFTLNVLTPTLFNDDKTNFTKVGVIDSGCAESQESFVKAYTSFTTKEYGFFSDDENVYDKLDHGTLICDIIHDESPNSELYSARIANYNGELTFQSILAAISWLVEEMEVDIINLSLGSVPYISDMLDQVFYEYQNETIFVASTGNGGDNNFEDSGYIEWPAVYPWVIGVGAYDGQNSLLPADYTVGGMGYFGNYVTEYLDDGSKSGKQGSSFAAPRITGRLSQLLFILRKNGNQPTLNELQGIFSTLTVGWNSAVFDKLSGWGKIDFDLLQSESYNKLNITDQTTIFHAVNETDVHNRFSDETWSRSWKFSTIGFDDPKNLHLDLIGNGVSLIDNYQIEINPWGGYLTINFNSNNKTGSYVLQVKTDIGNAFEYRFNIIEPSNGKILLDHRTSVNGYGHPYGEFSNFEGFLRSNGYIVHHKLLTEINYEYADYKSVIVPRFAEAQTIQNLTITRPLNDDLLDSYEQYVIDGGSLIILSDGSEYTNINQASQYLSRYSAEYTGLDIGSYSGLPQIVSNFSSDDIVTGVDEFFYIGGEIRSTGENTTELGWVKIAVDPFNVGFEFLSIGILGTIGNGNYLILGGTNFITNEYFENVPSSGFNILFNNFIDD
ncbi:MAG: Subtilisin DY [Candidatus Heimdallarchaeota archaeon LC_2]|nr:MAG: Subtilisin DY [Candidatus Heimdallarchaeota archaeon LC_2]